MKRYSILAVGMVLLMITAGCIGGGGNGSDGEANDTTVPAATDTPTETETSTGDGTTSDTESRTSTLAMTETPTESDTATETATETGTPTETTTEGEDLGNFTTKNLDRWDKYWDDKTVSRSGAPDSFGYSYQIKSSFGSPPTYTYLGGKSEDGTLHIVVYEGDEAVAHYGVEGPIQPGFEVTLPKALTDTETRMLIIWEYQGEITLMHDRDMNE